MSTKQATSPSTTPDETNTITRPFEPNSISLDEAEELVHIGTWKWDVASGDIIWSDELYRIYGLKPQGRSVGFEEFLQLIHPDDRERVSGLIGEAYQTKQSFEFEHRIVLPNEKIRILQGKGKVISDSKGNVTRMLGTSQDITERKKSDQALHRSEERFNAVSAATSDVVYDIGLENDTLWYNDALHTEYGYPRRLSYTPEWRMEHVCADDKDRIRASIDKVMHDTGTTWVGEYRFKKHDNTYVDVRDRAFILRDTHGKPIRMIGSMLDITQQKELERAKDRFISLVSHQLRTPLTSMRLLSEMLANDHDGELTATQQDFVEKIGSSTERMILLVNEILSVSSIETGHLNIYPVTTDIGVVVRGQIEEVTPLAEEKQVKLVYKSAETPQTSIVDPMLFSQIVHNLLTNAVRYSSKKGTTVDITFKKTHDKCLLVVKDKGIGIPTEAQSHIFSSFYRANNAIKTQGDGTGLGLYLTKLILDMTGGNIWFESQEEEGSTFYVSWPLDGMKSQDTK